MRRLDKSTLALTFKFDCDRFLRLRLATPEEQRRLDIEADRYGLDSVKARPNILWIRPARTGAPLIGTPTPGLAYELHVIDVKMAAEPSLRHFTEVTYYALALAAALRQHGLAERYAVSAEG